MKPSNAHLKLTELEKLIATQDSNKEVECGKILVEHFPNALLQARFNIEKPVYIPELIGFGGRSDVVVVGHQADGTGTIRRVAYVWEFKAPQCPLTVKSCSRVYRPSSHLFQAEDQLFRYTAEIRKSGTLKSTLKITDDADVYCGGIVIGRTDTLTNKPLSMDSGQADLEKQFVDSALSLRKTFIYNHHKLEIYTWSSIIEEIKARYFQNSEYKANEDVSTSLNTNIKEYSGLQNS